MAVGIIRKLDSLGRLTIPIEMRNYLKWKNEKTPLSVYVDEGCIIVKQAVDTVVTKAEIEDRLSKKYSEEEIAAIIKELDIED